MPWGPEEVVSSVSSHPEAPWVFHCTHSKYPITPPRDEEPWESDGTAGT